MNWLRARLAEPSTHAGLAVAFAVAGGLVPPQYKPLADAAALVLGFKAAGTADPASK